MKVTQEIFHPTSVVTEILCDRCQAHIEGRGRYEDTQKSAGYSDMHIKGVRIQVSPGSNSELAKKRHDYHYFCDSCWPGIQEFMLSGE